MQGLSKTFKIILMCTERQYRMNLSGKMRCVLICDTFHATGFTESKPHVLHERAESNTKTVIELKRSSIHITTSYCSCHLFSLLVVADMTTALR